MQGEKKWSQFSQIIIPSWWGHNLLDPEECSIIEGQEKKKDIAVVTKSQKLGTQLTLQN